VASKPGSKTSAKGCSDLCDTYITTGRDDRHLPFSELLHESCKYAENYASAELFEAPILQAILCHKWEETCRTHFMINFVAYVLYLMLLTYLIVFDHLKELGHCDTTVTSCMVSWYVWYICAVFSGLHIKFELHNLHTLGPKKYFTGSMRYVNQLGLASVLLTTIALVLMRDQTPGTWLDTALSPSALRGIHATALFGRWLKLLFFMRGLDSTAPLIKLLINIVIEMKSFMVLLIVILVCFSFVFFLLLRDTDRDHEEFGTIYDAFSHTYGIVLGSFHMRWFDAADTGGLATGLFVLFTVAVPVVMLNALIAIMSETYAVSKKSEVANGRLMRAYLILELETLITESQQADGSSWRSCGFCVSIWRVIQVLCTFRMRRDTQAAGTYLHVLSLEDPPSGAEQEYNLTSFPFKQDPGDGAPAVAIGELAHRENVPASKADVEKLMAQNVQLMNAMMRQQKKLEIQEEITTKLMQQITAAAGSTTTAPPEQMSSHTTQFRQSLAKPGN
jgi:hypothetical protein